jgi:serine/threonine protein kinase
MDSLLPGRDLHPRFKLVRRLTGNVPAGPDEANHPRMDVWLVHDEELDELVVAKILPPGTPVDRVDLLRQACKSARKLVHPNLLPVYDFHRGDEVSFVTMALAPGRPLDELENLSLDEILRVLIPVADALDYAHRNGVVHGGLRASKVFLDENGNPRVADFAVASLLSNGDRGEMPTVADDVRAFGALVFRLVTGRADRGEPFALPASAPEGLHDLLAATSTSARTDESHLPTPSMAEVRGKLEALRTRSPAAGPRKPAKRITPPPVVREVRPIRPDSRPSPAASAEAGGSGLGPKTIAAFALLFGIALAVFIVLPRWVERGKTATPRAKQASPSADPSSSPAEAPEGEPSPDLRTLAEEKTRAEQALLRARQLRDGLESRSVARWGGDDYAAAVEKLAAGEHRVAERDYAGGRSELEAAARSFGELEARARTVLERTLVQAKEALTGGRSAEATDLFQLALAVAPNDREASSGLERARHLDEVVSILSSGEEREKIGDLAGAAERYRRAASIDPLSPAAQKALARVDARASSEAFAAAMTDALAALGKKDFRGARSAFERARAIRPQAPEIASGLAAVADGERVSAIAAHRDRARALETEEDWHGAEAEYDKALALDPALRFAQEGKSRTSARALLDDKLDFQIGHPQRLSDENALKEAARLLDEARAVEGAGAKHRAKVAKLERIVDSSATPVEVQLLSDQLTEVTIYRVGKLGRFDRRALELRPGRYTVVGTRVGYRDVRHEVVVEAGKPPQPVLVRCEEKI